MSKIEEFKKNLQEHNDIKCSFDKDISNNRIYTLRKDVILITTKKDGNDWQHSGSRIRDFLRVAINEKLDELLKRAFELSEENVSCLRAAAEDEAINFIKSIGAGENHECKS